MASSIISYKSNFFWAGDSLLTVVVYYLLPLIRKSKGRCQKDDEEWFDNYLLEFELILKGLSMDNVDFDLDNLALSPCRLKIFLEKLVEVKDFFLEKEAISVAELKAIEDIRLGEKQYFKNPVRSEVFIKIIDDIVFLLSSDTGTGTGTDPAGADLAI